MWSLSENNVSLHSKNGCILVISNNCRAGTKFFFRGKAGKWNTWVSSYIENQARFKLPVLHISRSQRLVSGGGGDGYPMNTYIHPYECIMISCTNISDDLLFTVQWGLGLYFFFFHWVNICCQHSYVLCAQSWKSHHNISIYQIINNYTRQLQSFAGRWINVGQ